ncbi:Uncharacterized protein APZ42_027888 [Daphnia magna]|uniref:Uncharacterized protein n=1 Tax=Daphnia magna TaxID=35525 RepID=A0A0P5CSF7_9CRUS|nr:Uncharacterized protein APZ42_027888 [Daphnia magna]
MLFGEMSQKLEPYQHHFNALQCKILTKETVNFMDNWPTDIAH